MAEQVGVYGYPVGLHLVVDMQSGTAPRCDVYVDANINEDLTVWMQERLLMVA